MRLDGSQQVLILTGSLGGGTGNHILSMIKYWDKSVWPTRIINMDSLNIFESPDVPIHYLPPSKHFHYFPFAQMRYISKIYGGIRGKFNNIFHAYFFWPIIYGRLLKLTGKITTLVENREDQGFSWGLHEYTWLRMTRTVPDRVICVSEDVRNVVLDREGIDPARVVVIKNGVGLAHGRTGDVAATRQELGIREENLIVGMVANYNRAVKGVSYFLDAISIIIKEVPSARFLLVGGGNYEARQSLRSKAREMGIEPFVIFTGYQKEIQRYYQIMDISVLTSLSEGLSITLLESMAHALPVVVTRVGGNPEVVIDEKTGYLVPTKDIHTLAKRISRLLLDPELRRRMGDEGRKRIEQHFQLRDVSKRYLEVYQDLISSNA
jgi:glycosyltransferase involved in cell wall biosynthesis